MNLTRVGAILSRQAIEMQVRPGDGGSATGEQRPPGGISQLARGERRAWHRDQADTYLADFHHGLLVS